MKYISPWSVKAISQSFGKSPSSSSAFPISSRLLCSSSSKGSEFNVVASIVDLFLCLLPGAEGLAPGRWVLFLGLVLDELFCWCWGGGGGDDDDDVGDCAGGDLAGGLGVP